MRMGEAHVGLTIVFLLLVSATYRCAGGAEVYEFELEKVSGFGVSYGHGESCQDEPMAQTIYPVLVSAKPWYGEIRVDMVLDRPGDSGTAHRFVVDESKGTGSGCDRLYIDLDADGDLTDEEPVAVMADPPEVTNEPKDDDSIVQRVSFNCVTFSSTGDEGQIHSMEVMPRLTLRQVKQEEYAHLRFMPTKARCGEIEIAGRRFIATMSNNRPLGTRFDRPLISLQLEAISHSDRLPYWAFSDRLAAVHRIDGQYWFFSTTPAGDRLFVTRYEGDLGTFTMNSGRLLGPKRCFTGVLLSETHAIRLGSESSDDPDDEKVQSLRVPVGDYRPAVLNVYDGPLFSMISDNYHLDGQPRGRRAPLTFGVRIRRDKTYRLDLSEKPDVLFASPGRDARVKLGEDLTVKAVLVNPKLDIMIRDMKRKDEAVRDILSPNAAVLIAVVFGAPLVSWLVAGHRGRHRSVPVVSILGLLILAGIMTAGHVISQNMTAGHTGLQGYDELVPAVTISRAGGQVVAHGRMPFG